MGITRTVEWKLVCPPDEADRRIRSAFEELEFEPEGPSGEITGRAKRSVRKNRWAADLSVRLSPLEDGALALCRVEMSAGNKHFAVLSEVAESVGEDAFADQGVTAAVERLGKASRLFGRKEIGHLRNILRASEAVLELGQGQFEGKQGLVVLTSERLFFFEKSLGSETVEEFPLAVVDSLSVHKKVTGETLAVFSAGNRQEITSMNHGQGDALVRAYNAAKRAPAAPPAAAPAAGSDDPYAQLERLGDLRDKGLLSDAEFEAKKADVLSRM